MFYGENGQPKEKYVWCARQRQHNIGNEFKEWMRHTGEENLRGRKPETEFAVSFTLFAPHFVNFTDWFASTLMFFGVDFSSRRRTEVYVHLESVSEKFHRQYRSVNPGNKWVLLAMLVKRSKTILLGNQKNKNTQESAAILTK